MTEDAGMNNCDSKIVVGIDFGTTNSVIAFINNEGDAEVIPIKNKYLLPSILSFDEMDNPVVGELGEDTVISIKRLIGANKKKALLVDSLIQSLESRNLDSASIAMEIFKSLKVAAENYTGKKIYGAVITVPAHFDNVARSTIKFSAEKAGIKVIRMLNEPTAAAIANSLLKQKMMNLSMKDNLMNEPFTITDINNANDIEFVLVYDLGGGTFDISLLEISNKLMRVIACNGDSMLGGDDFDQVLIDLLNYKIKGESFTIESSSVYDKLKARSIKEYLSDNLYWEGEWKENKITVTQKEFNDYAYHLVEETLIILDKLLKECSITIKEISQILLVGGATKIPLVQKSIIDWCEGKKYNNKIIINNTLDPELVVAIGAAQHAYSLISPTLIYNSNLNKLSHILLDVLPLSIGIETLGGGVEKIIHRNTPIPIAAKSSFTNAVYGQEAFDIHIVQGESDMVNECRSLVRFSIPINAILEAKTAILEITFFIDHNGILNINAIEKVGDSIKEVIINISYGLDENEIIKYLSRKPL